MGTNVNFYQELDYLTVILRILVFRFSTKLKVSSESSFTVKTETHTVKLFNFSDRP